MSNLKLHAERASVLREQLEALTARYELEEAKVKAEMEKEQIQDYYHNGLKFERGEKENRSLDKLKYKERVSEEDFFESVKIGITEAKKYLGERALEECLIYGKKTPYFKVSKTKKAKEEAVKQVHENTAVIRENKKDNGKKKVERI